VKEHFGHPEMPDPGFTAEVDVSKLNGKYELGLARIHNGTVETCRQFSMPLLITH
jgi:hypothetical protein